MGCSAGSATPASSIPAGSHGQGASTHCTQQGVAKAAHQNRPLQHGLPSLGGQQPAAPPISGPKQGNGTGSSMPASSGNVRQMQRPRANGFIPPRKFVAPQSSKAAVPQPCLSDQQPISRTPFPPGAATQLQAAGKPGPNAHGGSSSNRTQLTHGAAARLEAAVKPDPDACGGSSSLAPGAQELPFHGSTPGASPASPHDPQQQSLKVSKHGNAQGAAAKAVSTSAERKGGGGLASTGQGQAAQNRAAAGHPLARRRLVKAAQIQLPDTQVYEQPRASPPLHPPSLSAADSLPSRDQHGATARIAQAARSPVMSPQACPADESPYRRFSPGAMPWKRQKHRSDAAGDASHSPGPSQSAERSEASEAPSSPAMSGTLMRLA